MTAPLQPLAEPRSVTAPLQPAHYFTSQLRLTAAAVVTVVAWLFTVYLLVSRGTEANRLLPWVAVHLNIGRHRHLLMRAHAQVSLAQVTSELEGLLHHITTVGGNLRRALPGLTDREHPHVRSGSAVVMPAFCRGHTLTATL